MLEREDRNLSRGVHTVISSSSSNGVDSPRQIFSDPLGLPSVDYAGQPSACISEREPASTERVASDLAEGILPCVPDDVDTDAGDGDWEDVA